ncbi:uncharacterized protein V6R79_012728 [Siganus canaliculatus]
MPDFCAAFGCSIERNAKTKEKGITFHRFPKDTSRRQAWTVAVRRKGFVPQNRSVICSCHFKPEDFDKTGQTTRLKDGVVPSVFSFPENLRKVASTPRPSQTQQQQQPAESTQQQRTHSPVTVSISEKSSSDHQYALDPVTAKKKLIEAQEKVEELQRIVRNARNRERRQRQTVQFLMDDLKNTKMLTEELQQKLDYYSCAL